MAYTFGVICALILFIVVGNYAGTKVKNVDDYYVSGRQAPTILIVGTLLASYLSTNALMGESSFMYVGYPGAMLILMSINACGYIAGALWFGRYIRRSEAKTVPEYFGMRFSPKVQKAAAVTILIGVFAYLFAVTQGVSIVMGNLLGVDRIVALLIAWLTYTSFTFYGGSKGVILTDTIMCFIFFLAILVAVPFTLNAVGGWTNVVTTLATFDLKPDMMAFFSLTGDGAYWSSPLETVGWALIYGFVWALVVATSPWQTSRYLMAKNEHVVLRSGMLSTVLVLFFYLTLAIVAVSLNLVDPNMAGEQELLSTALGQTPIQVFPTWLGVIIVTGILSAALSSASTFLSLIGFSVVNDLGLGKSDTNHMLRNSRAAMLLVSIFALIACYLFPPDIMWATYFAATVFASSWGPVCFLSIWWKKVTEDGAFWSIIVGFLTNVFAKVGATIGLFSLPTFADPFVIGFLCSLATLIVVSLAGKPTEEQLAYRQNLFDRIPVDQYSDKKEAKTTLLFPWIIIGGGVVYMILLIVFYAIPYLNAIA